MMRINKIKEVLMYWNDIIETNDEQAEMDAALKALESLEREREKRDIDMQIKALESLLEIPQASAGPIKVEFVSHDCIRSKIKQLRKGDTE